MTLRVFTDPAVTGYATPGHPEAPERVSRSAQRLKAAGWKLEVPDHRATPDDAKSVHSETHWSALQSGMFEDPDTPYFDGIADIALTSLSGCLSAYEAARAGTSAFSLMRPPGHHAGRERISGFCYLNNVAVAVERAVGRGERVAIVDIDVHHGDGTESIALGRPGWWYASIHQSPLYPGTGLASRKNCVNFPLPPYTEEPVYLETLERAIRGAMDFKPDLLAVSAGFDTYKECPIAQFRLEIETYRRIGKMLAQTGLRRFAALEGGYASDLPEIVEQFLEGFAG